MRFHFFRTGFIFQVSGFTFEVAGFIFRGAVSNYRKGRMQNFLLFCIRPFLVPELVCPISKILLGGVCLENLSFDELCALATREKRFIGLAHTAAAGGSKRNDGFAHQVMALQKGVDDRGRNIPPDGKTDIHNIIAENE